MKKNLIISGFADEIDSSLDEQIRVLNDLGIGYLSLRGVDGTNIGEYTLEAIEQDIAPRLEAGGIKVSSIGSPIGKIQAGDEAAFEKQKAVLDTLCRACGILDCRYIRVFSFYIPEGEDADAYKDEVIEKMKAFAAIAEGYGVVLLHENEKDIYGDIARRCRTLIDEVGSPSLRGIFDFANFVQCGEDTQACYDLLRDTVDYIHIKDAVYDENDNVLCGTGDGKIPELLKAFVESGYEGFLTLEPHLVLFDSLKDLEIRDAAEVIKDNKGMTGAEAYAKQYHALRAIIDAI